jgi:tubulin polyglutamylase TTLL2
LVYDTNIVVQKYVKNPMLIGGYKYDLRLYVLVPSFHPLTIYMYREGLTRFSTDKYSLNNLDNLFAHLTNSSINKLGPNYSETKEKIGLGNYIVILFHLVSASSYRY